MREGVGAGVREKRRGVEGPGCEKEKEGGGGCKEGRGRKEKGRRKP